MRPLASLISPTFLAAGLVFFLSESQSPAVVRARNVVLGGAPAGGQEVKSHCELRLLLRGEEKKLPALGH